MKMLLMQLPNPNFSLIKQFGNTPLAAGYLKGMADRAGLLGRMDIELLDHDIMNLGTDSAIIQHVIDQAPDILGFTLYLWNTERSLYIANEVKKHLPYLKVIAGGPEVTPDNEFLLSHEIIDLGCHKEGELTFVDIVKYFLGEIDNLDEIKGIFHRESGQIVFTEPREPVTDLSIIPSPFLKGYIDPSRSPVISLETSRGCRYNCKYCSWENRPQSAFPPGRIGKELRLIRESGVKNVTFINSDILTALSDQDGALMHAFEEVNDDRQLALYGFLSAEHVTDEKADMLQRLGFRHLGVGLQSVNPRTLNRIGRKAQLEKFVAGCHRLARRNIGMELEFIIGLPHDTVDDYRRIYKFAAEHNLVSKRDQLMPFVLLLLPGTSIRREIEEHEIVYNPRPPYQLYRSKYLSEQEIKEATRLRVTETAAKQMNRGRCGLLSLLSETYTVIPNQAGTLRSLQDLGQVLSGKLINKIIIRLDAHRQNAQQLAELGRELGGNMLQPLTLWLKSEDMDRDLELAESLAGSILENNPFLLLSLILEVSKPFSLSVIETLKQLPAQALVINSTAIDKALNIGVLLPFNSSWNSGSDEQTRFTQGVDLCWTVQLDPQGDWKQTLKQIQDAPGYGLCLLDIAPGITAKQSTQILNFIARNDPMKYKVVFRSFELTSALNCFHTNLQRRLARTLGLSDTKDSFKHANLETIVAFDEDLQHPRKFFAPGPQESTMIRDYIKTVAGASRARRV